MKITSIKKLLEVSQGELVNLPPFALDTEFVAKLKRPSMMKLASNGKIPNALLSRANALFVERATEDPDTEEMLQELGQVMDVIAEACFVEPSWEQLKEAGIELTDEQYIAIFQYSQKGLEQLKPSDGAEENSGYSSNVENV